MSRKVLGIDIRDQSISAVLLNSSLREHHVDDFIHLPYSGADDAERSLSAALETLTERMDLTGSDYVVSVPSQQFVFRNLSVPFRNAKKIGMMLPFELEPTLPFPIEDLVIDFYTLDSKQPKDQTDLIAAGIEKNHLEPYLEALKSVGMDPEKLTLNGLPAALCLAHEADPQKDLLYIDIDETFASLIIVAGRRPQLIRSIPLPANSSAKTSILCAQIQQTLAAFQESGRHNLETIEVFVSGLGLVDAQTTADMSKVLEMPVNVASIAEQLDIPVVTDSEKEWDPGRMDNALALALMEVEGYQGLNFHKGQFAAQKFLTKHKSALIKTGIFSCNRTGVDIFF